jgi:hypothetical protein
MGNERGRPHPAKTPQVLVLGGGLGATPSIHEDWGWRTTFDPPSVSFNWSQRVGAVTLENTLEVALPK